MLTYIRSTTGRRSDVSVSRPVKSHGPRFHAEMALHKTNSLCRGLKAYSCLPFIRAPQKSYSSVNTSPNGQEVACSNEHRLQLLHNQFNASQISYTIGYGSGVVQQAGYSGSSQPQVDLIHVVEDPVQFHVTNSAAHPNHYSGLLRLGIPVVGHVQNMGAGVYFNPYVKIKDINGNTTVVKYGVVSSHVALQDLTQWTSLYVAGRLHKPVKHVYDADQKLRDANEYNLQSVFSLATLLLGKKAAHVSLAQIFKQIAAISYMGDPRMFVGGENPNKVKNIVSRQQALFERLYERSIATSQERGVLKKSSDSFSISLTPDSISDLLNNLPGNFKRRLLSSYKTKYLRQYQQDQNVSLFLDGDGEISNDSPFLKAIATDKFLAWTLRNTISGIIAYPALIQSFKGIFTAGITKSVKYAWEKKMKGMKR